MIKCYQDLNLFHVSLMLDQVIINKKITIPGKFVGFHGSPAVTCSHKAAQGFIYPLERGFIYIYKPPIFIRYNSDKTLIILMLWCPIALLEAFFKLGLFVISIDMNRVNCTAKCYQ